MNARKTICKVMLSTMIVALTLTACNSDSDLASTIGSGLWIKPAVAGATETRAVGDDVAADASLNENALKSIDVFIGKNGQFTKLNKRFSSNLTTTDGTLQVAGSDWETVYNEPPYEIYVVANATDATTPNTTTKETLAAKTQTDADICAPYSATTNKSKTFLMDGKLELWTPKSDETAIVELRRAAAKIVVSVVLSGNMAQQYTAGAIQWKMVDFATTASLIAEGESLTAGNGDTGTTTYQANGNTITTYSYPCQWTNSDEAPRLLVNIPLTSVSDGTVKANNWYTIPVRDINGEEKQLDRNHIYYVEATISSQGSATELINSQDVKLKYRAIDWKDIYDTTWTDDDVTINATKTDYFMVYPTEVSMRNVTTDTSVEYYASGNVTAVVDSVYFYNESGVYTVYSDKDKVKVTANNGKITIYSPIPDDPSAMSSGNFTVRYIRFCVYRNEDPDNKKYVLVKQYPLEFVQNIEGKYSTRTESSWCEWGKRSGTSSDNNFQVKVYYNGKIYQYSGSSNRGSATGQDNNHMYVIQLSSTSDDYTIAHITVDENGQSQENFASPAFMLASQLGTVYPFADSYDRWGNQTASGGKNAAIHCSTYKEVGTDGTEYTGWRLPTQKEIGVIERFQQSSYGAPMTTVLGGLYYWAADGTAVRITGGDGGSTSSAYVRCIRDLTPTEVAEVNKKK